MGGVEENAIVGLARAGGRFGVSLAATAGGGAAFWSA